MSPLKLVTKLPPREPVVIVPTVPVAAETDPVMVSVLVNVPIILTTYNAYALVSALKSLPTTTAVAPDVPPVITSPRFKHTWESPLMRRAEPDARPPTLTSVLNVPATGVYTILVAGVT